MQIIFFYPHFIELKSSRRLLGCYGLLVETRHKYEHRPYPQTRSAIFDFQML